ncbi:hypothetical protein M0804_008956 [Polistes exclamans]|nr:hypothetical protein M0804_008956 [Polistes exclamans]
MSKSQNNTTIAELKEKCKELGCSTSGSKTELIQRLREDDPSEAWAQKNVTNTAPRVVCEKVRFPDAEDVGRFLNDNCEEEVRRNDKHLLEEELKLVRRELELVRSLRGASISTERRQLVETQEQSYSNPDFRERVDIRLVADLLNVFKGEMGEYENWERQLRMLRATYSLNDNQVRMLISMRLKEKALEWFHSKSDYVTIPIEELLADLRSTFCHRKNRIVLRKIFEERVWRKDESFHEYVHNKVILGNKVPIHENEIVDYIIEGIPDANLKNQAKINRLRTKADILEAFEGVTLQEKNRIPGDTRFVRRPYNMKNWNTERWKSTKQTKSCFICESFDHMADSCPKKKEGPTCYNCKKRGHIASNCPKKYPVVKESISKVQRENRKTFNKKRVEAKVYRDGDLVAIKRMQQGPGLKLANKFLGPYTIIKEMRNNRYLVRRVGEHEGPLQTSTAADYMKPWISKEGDISDSESESDISDNERVCENFNVVCMHVL